MDASRALLATLAALALAGCATPAAPQAAHPAPGAIEQTGLLHASGQEQAAPLDCPGVGDLSYSVVGSAGSLAILVTDDGTGTVLDTGPLQGDAHSTVRGLLGGQDRWTVTVSMQAFTGGYSVALAC
ncbi:MAG: hypothetical protein LC623_01415 [Halobacteriales archaeon]|nr:hypothetical protein [Halobacteriales archaeon]